jgi:DNA-directed RNA polymerase subunit RPC12/RpoP
MYRLKGCIRCGGDVSTDRDEYGWYEGCLQCGRQINLEILIKLRELIDEIEKEPALAIPRKI